MAAMIHNARDWVFVWRGGKYIDIHHQADFRLDMIQNRPLVPFYTIDIWDYGIDKPSIQRLVDFKDECDKWLSRRHIPPNAGFSF